eukprot:10480702-Alexandrium_andersonii.AAC.1
MVVSFGLALPALGSVLLAAALPQVGRSPERMPGAHCKPATWGTRRRRGRAGHAVDKGTRAARVRIVRQSSATGAPAGVPRARAARTL